MMELVVIAADMQEVIGSSLAIYLLSRGRIPIFAGVLITMVDTFLILLMERFGIRKLEAFFGILIAIMAIMFGVDSFVVEPDKSEVLEGLVIPWCESCDSEALNKAVGLLGSVIMPHNLYLHSALISTSRDIDRTKPNEVKMANFYTCVEAAIALSISLFINMSIVVTFGGGLYDVTNSEIRQDCFDRNVADIYKREFANDTDEPEINIYNGGIYLGCTFGMACLYIWGIGVLASGQAATITGTYSGQFLMEGFLDLKLSKWQRLLLSRTVAIGPTIIVALFKGIDNLTYLNDILNVWMSIQLPFAAIPLLYFTNYSPKMGQYQNSTPSKVVTSLIVVMSLTVNLVFTIQAVLTMNLAWPVLILLPCFALFYAMIVTALLYLCCKAQFSSGNIQNINGSQDYIMTETDNTSYNSLEK